MKRRPRVVFDARTRVYSYLTFPMIFKVCRLLCKGEFSRVLKASNLITKERREETEEFEIPSADKVQTMANNSRIWFDFFFTLVPRP